MVEVNKASYDELSKAKVSESRNIVISKCNKGGYTMAQQLEVNEGSRVTSVFMKGAFHIEDKEGLVNLRDAINLAIKKEDDKDSSLVSDNDWD